MRSNKHITTKRDPRGCLLGHPRKLDFRVDRRPTGAYYGSAYLEKKKGVPLSSKKRPKAASTIKPEEREFVVGSGASMHMVSRKDLDSADLETVRISKSPMAVVTANGEVLTKEEATVYVKELDLFVTVMLLDGTPEVLSLGKLYEDHWYNCHWTSGQKPTSHQKWLEDQLQHSELRTFRCLWSIDKFFNFIFTYYSHIFIAGNRDSHRSSNTTRSESKSVEVQGSLSHGPAETENPNKNVDNEEVRGNSSHDLPEWLHEFRHSLVDESVPEHRDDSSSSHELLSEPRTEVVSGKHSIFNHFPKDRNCDICLRTKITRAYCRKRTGTVVPRAENFGD